MVRPPDHSGRRKSLSHLASCYLVLIIRSSSCHVYGLSQNVMDSTYNHLQSTLIKSTRGGINIKHVSAKIISTKTTQNFKFARIKLLRHLKKYLRCIKYLLSASHPRTTITFFKKIEAKNIKNKQ